MKNEIKKGFIAPQITIDNHILGGVGIPLPVINPSGDWTTYLPIFESQLENTFDSDGCTVYGTLNAIETLEKFLYGVETNHSDRFTYNSVGITPPGSDPHLVATNIRGAGLVLESDLPSVVSSLAEFMTPRPLTPDLRVKGESWLAKQMLGHQWLWAVQPDQATRLSLIKEGLTKGTVCVSVCAWFKDNHGLYYSPMGQQNAHWTHVYKIDDTGIYVFDSYNDAESNTNLRKLTLDHNIQFAKVYFFTKPTEEQNWLQQLITAFLTLVGLKQQQQVVTPVVPVSPPVSPIGQPKYLWDIKDNIRHSIRLIADEEGLTVLQKDLACDISWCESKYVITQRGIIDPRDRGLFQWNSHYHPEITDEIAFNPEKNARLGCKAIKAGKAHAYWSASEYCWNENHKYDALL